MGSMVMEAGKIWLEWRGRGKAAPRYIFQDNEIVSPTYPRNVSQLWKATYLNLHPTHYAVAVSPDGRIMNLKGGYNLLSPGKYNIYYVDKQNRVYHLPRTVETTSDGFQVAIILAITYRVIDPLKALEVQNAVDTLIRFIQSDLREFIRTHRHDEIVGDPNGPRVDDEEIVRFVKNRHSNRHQMSKLFFLADVVIQEKIGDPKVTEIRGRYQVSQRQVSAQLDIQKKNTELAETVANQEATIQSIRAQTDKKLQEQNIELDKVRAGYQYPQENWRTAIGAIVQTLSNQSYPPDARVIEIIKDLLKELHSSTAPAPGTENQATQSQNGPGKAENSDRIQKLTNDLLNWRRPTPPS